MRVVERLLRRIDLAGDDAGLFEFAQRLAPLPPHTPFAHPPRAPSTVWPRRVRARSCSAASVQKADRKAVPKSTHGTFVMVGTSGVPDRYTAPDIAWPMPSKPCLCDKGPPAPKPVTVVRMMSG